MRNYFEILNEEIKSYNTDCFCMYCGDTGDAVDFHKIHTNYLCPICFTWAKHFQLEEPTFIEFVNYPKYIQNLILRLNNASNESELFHSVESESNLDFLLEKLHYLKSLVFKSNEVLRRIKELKIRLCEHYNLEKFFKFA